METYFSDHKAICAQLTTNWFRSTIVANAALKNSECLDLVHSYVRVYENEHLGEVESKFPNFISIIYLIPHMHHVVLTRVITVEGLYIIDLCWDMSC